MVQRAADWARRPVLKLGCQQSAILHPLRLTQLAQRVFLRLEGRLLFLALLCCLRQFIFQLATVGDPLQELCQRLDVPLRQL